jgi:hypothetical protein
LSFGEQASRLNQNNAYSLHPLFEPLEIALAAGAEHYRCCDATNTVAIYFGKNHSGKMIEANCQSAPGKARSDG